MKKSALLWLMCLVLGFVNVGCSDDTDKTVYDSVYLYVTTVEVPAAGTDENGISVTVSTTTDWTATTDADWYTLSLTKGEKGFTAVHVIVEPNTTGEVRAGVATFKAGTYTEALNIIQKAE